MLALSAVGLLAFVGGIAFTLTVAPAIAQRLVPPPPGIPRGVLVSLASPVREQAVELNVIAPDGSVRSLGRGSYWNRNPFRRIAYALFEKPAVERRISAHNAVQRRLAEGA